MTWDRLKPRQQVHGWEHQKARKRWAARHHPDDACVRCNQPLGPMGPHLHLDHHDIDKTRYLGFAHGTCNRDAGAALGRARQKQQRLGSRTRDW